MANLKTSSSSSGLWTPAAAGAHPAGRWPLSQNTEGIPADEAHARPQPDHGGPAEVSTMPHWHQTVGHVGVQLIKFGLYVAVCCSSPALLQRSLGKIIQKKEASEVCLTSRYWTGELSTTSRTKAPSESYPEPGKIKAASMSESYIYTSSAFVSVQYFFSSAQNIFC